MTHKGYFFKLSSETKNHQSAIISYVLILGFRRVEVVGHEPLIFKFFLLGKIFPSCDFSSAPFRPTKTRLRKILYNVVFHGVIKSQLFSCFDQLHGHVIMAFSIVHFHTAVGFTAVVDFAVNPRMKDPSVPIDLASVRIVFFSLILNVAFHRDLSWLKISNCEDSFASTWS